MENKQNGISHKHNKEKHKQKKNKTAKFFWQN